MPKTRFGDLTTRFKRDEKGEWVYIKLFDRHNFCPSCNEYYPKIFIRCTNKNCNKELRRSPRHNKVKQGKRKRTNIVITKKEDLELEIELQQLESLGLA